MIAFILAAGQSQRFKGIKQLADFQGKTFLNHVIDELDSTQKFDLIVVILGAYYSQIKQSLIHKNVYILNNESYKNGKSTSINKAIEFAKKKNKSFLITTVDIPLVTTKDYLELINQSTTRAVFSSFDDIISVPCFVPKNYLDELKTLKGEEGLKSIIKKFDTVKLENAKYDIDDLKTYHAITDS